jgi:pimeloyl-ACP methyl ester carboxylesterase
VAAARRLAQQHPHWGYVELPDVGHVPQLQVPDRVATEIDSWLTATSGLESPV